jgi:hypothetical protein
VTVPIAQVLATLPSGDGGRPLNDLELGTYLREHLDTDAEKARNARHVRRDELYRDGSTRHILELVERVFEDRTVRELRKRLVPLARYANLVKRVVRETSTMYSEPARRYVGGGEANQRAYDRLIGDEGVRLDAVAQEVNRLHNLHRSLLVGYRVRVNPDGSKTPVLDVATPSIVRAILHPNDPSLVVGWLIRSSFRTARSLIGLPRQPVWALWTDHEYGYLDESMIPVGPLVPHGFGVNRWVPLSYAVNHPGFWPGEEGEDLVSAQLALGLIAVLLVKETKSATQQTFLTGDTSAMDRAQSLDTERPGSVPEGVGVLTVDMSVDPAQFIAPSDHIEERAGNGYGLSGPLLRHQGVQSAEARELMRMPLRELRKEQTQTYRVFEKQLARVMAAVTAKDWPEAAFSVDDWAIDFGEGQTPLSEREALALFLDKRAAGVDNTIDYVRRLNPDLPDDEAARAEILTNISVETWRVGEMRDLQAMSGGMSTAGVPPEATPSEEQAV